MTSPSLGTTSHLAFPDVAGRVPFKSDSILGLYDEIRNAPLVFPEDVFVSDSLKRLLSGLLDKDPENRMSLTGAMYHQWTTHNGAYPLPNIQVPDPRPTSAVPFLARYLEVCRLSCTRDPCFSPYCTGTIRHALVP